MKKFHNRILLLLIAFLFPVLTWAHGYWFDVKGSGKVNEQVKIQVCFGEIDETGVRLREKGSRIAQVAGFKVFVVDSKGERTDIVLHQLEDHWEGVFTPKEKDVYQILGINDKLPVLNPAKRKMNIRPIQYLCTSYTTTGSAKAVQEPVQFIDIITLEKDKFIIVKAYKNKIPADSSLKLRIFNPENWEKAPAIDEKGEASFMPTMKGLYIVRLEWNERRPDTFDGVPIDGFRHRCDYTLRVD